MKKRHDKKTNLYPKLSKDSRVYIPSEQEVLDEKREVEANQK